MMSDVPDLSVFQVVWPGVSTLLGAIAGGGVTLVANRQKNSQEQRASKETRTQSIKDRSFSACVDVLKSGRLLAAASHSMAWNMYQGESHHRIAEREASFDKALRNWYSVSEVGRLTVPPAIRVNFEEYMDALTAFLQQVDTWKSEYLASPPPNKEAEPAKTAYLECQALEDVALAKRTRYVDLAKKQFDGNAWSTGDPALDAIYDLRL
jgi:hypothetical protein